MPSPVSVTVTVTLVASAIADTVTVPSGGVCRTAFSSRLVNSRVSSEPLPGTMSPGSMDSSRTHGPTRAAHTASAASSSASIRHTGPTSRANAAGVGPGEEEQLLHDPALPAGGGVDRGEEFAVALLGPGVLQGQAGVRLDDRQRRAQLVGGVGGEPALAVERLFQPRQHRVDGGRQLGEFIAARHRQSFGKIARSQPRGRPGDLPDRAERAAGQKGAAQPGGEQSERHEGQERGRQPVDLPQNATERIGELKHAIDLAPALDRHRQNPHRHVAIPDGGIDRPAGEGASERASIPGLIPVLPARAGRGG